MEAKNLEIAALPQARAALDSDAAALGVEALQLRVGKQAQVEVERLSSANQAQTNQLMQLAMSDGTGAVLPATREDPYYNLILQLQQEKKEEESKEESKDAATGDSDKQPARKDDNRISDASQKRNQ